MPAFIVADQGSIASRIREVLNFGGLDCPSSHVLATEDAASRLGREPSIDLVVVALGPDLERAMGLPGFLARVCGETLAQRSTDAAASSAAR